MTFGGGTGPISGIAGVRAHFGDGPQTQEYVALLKAVRAMTTVSEAYFLAEEGSGKESVAGVMFGQMVDDLREHPDKAASLVEAMCALIVHMKIGGTFQEWFEGVDG